MSSVNPKNLDTYSDKYPDFLGVLKRVVFRTNGRCNEFYFTRPRFNEEVGGWAFEMQLYQTLRVTNAQLITSTFRNVDGRDVSEKAVHQCTKDIGYTARTILNSSNSRYLYILKQKDNTREKECCQNQSYLVWIYENIPYLREMRNGEDRVFCKYRIYLLYSVESFPQ